MRCSAVLSAPEIINTREFVCTGLGWWGLDEASPSEKLSFVDEIDAGRILTVYAFYFCLSIWKYVCQLAPCQYFSFLGGLQIHIFEPLGQLGWHDRVGCTDAVLQNSEGPEISEYRWFKLLISKIELQRRQSLCVFASSAQPRKHMSRICSQNSSRRKQKPFSLGCFSFCRNEEYSQGTSSFDFC